MLPQEKLWNQKMKQRMMRILKKVLKELIENES